MLNKKLLLLQQALQQSQSGLSWATAPIAKVFSIKSLQLCIEQQSDFQLIIKQNDTTEGR